MEQQLLKLAKDRNQVETTAFLPFFEHIQFLRTRTQRFEKDIKRETQKFKDLSGEKNETGRTLQRLRNERESGELTIETVNKLKKELTNTRTRLEEQFKKRNEYLEYERSYNSLNSSLSNLIKSNEALEKKNKKLETDIFDSKTSLKIHEEEVQSLKGEIQHQEESIINITKENSALRRKLKQPIRLPESEPNMLRKHKSNKEIVKIKRSKTSSPNRRNTTNIKKSFSGGRVAISKVPHGQRLVYDAHTGENTCLRFSHDSNLLVTGSTDSNVKIWHAISGASKMTLTGPTKLIYSVGFDLNNEKVLASSHDSDVYVWNFRNEEEKGPIRLKGHTAPVYTAVFSNDGTQVISGSQDRTIKIFSIENPKSPISLNSICAVNSISLFNNSNRNCLLSAGFDKTVRLYDLRSNQIEKSIPKNHGGQITSVVVSRDEKYFVTNCRDNKIRLFDLRKFKNTKTFKHKKFKNGYNWNRAVFSPDQGYIAAGSQTGCILIFNTINGKLEKLLKSKPSSAITDIDWIPSGEFLATGDRKSKIKIWA
ncbi:autophagy-related 16 isoform f [Anaeramoeba flamelloides]|uniref:Autophagy-related 16 isoform f n=1 Tax=Anaeramoeba flamelloides TaxID=1746091 RepID=A0AAV7YU46_9EUKA|nr:autophagy-related 16 isoform f [Anaeramoeba flamelloides]